MDDFGYFGDDGGLLGGIAENPSVAGPLIGGGLAQAGLFATKLITKNATAQKWAPAIGGAVGVAASAAMIASPRFRQAGISSLITALLVAVPRQLEVMLVERGVFKGTDSMSGYLGVIAPEQTAGYFGEMDAAADMQGLAAGEVQLLDSGSGSTGVLGVIAPEQTSGYDGAGPVEMMGSGFGSSFLG
jgi:hypothetical protein